MFFYVFFVCFHLCLRVVSYILLVFMCFPCFCMRFLFFCMFLELLSTYLDYSSVFWACSERTKGFHKFMMPHFAKLRKNKRLSQIKNVFATYGRIYIEVLYWIVVLDNSWLKTSWILIPARSTSTSTSTTAPPQP